ncbi:hypothetical protein HKK52_00395 [Pseudomonas sp. ADAK2]|uniref:hypothetical protein n=1 Tax=unclassified Pseudomonas TaxID=196821 RepID=UPI0014647B33|nr:MULTISPECIES: hypothetical protein [unclassified Pseudomonas]QJI39450.1 hypothetical protein HKK53_00395 [Pseudomonas sp. ADAK7]QJI45756.1 hypothetical protein HKK52_00395 [Pseudomonas sp. ADAK2]
MSFGSPDAYLSLVSGLVGALIGGAFTLKGATKAHELALKKEQAADKEKMITTLMLLRTEIATAWALFKYEYADELSQQAPETPYLTVFPIGASPFPIFDSAPQALNLLPSELAKDVVHFYMRAKGLIAMIEMNNRDYEQALQHARSLLLSHLERAREQNGEMPDNLRDQIFHGGVAFMAAHLGMGDTADGIRSLGQELDPIVRRITTTVDALFFPISDQ